MLRNQIFLSIFRIPFEIICNLFWVMIVWLLVSNENQVCVIIHRHNPTHRARRRLRLDRHDLSKVSLRLCLASMIGGHWGLWIRTKVLLKRPLTTRRGWGVSTTRLTYKCAHLRSTKESLTFEYDMWWFWVSMVRYWLVLGGTGAE